MYVWKQLSPSVPHRLAMGVAIGMTDTGTVRISNEDNFLIDAQLGLVAVADGMGGHDGGELASSSALGSLAHFIRARMKLDDGADLADFLPAYYDPAEHHPERAWSDAERSAMAILHGAVEYANMRMYQTNVDNHRGDGNGMGTTLSGIWQAAEDGPLYLFHIGDSRIYRLRQGQLQQLTRDQTVYQLAVEAGELDNLPSRNLLLQALGPAPMVVPELHAHTLAAGDLYMLCSDGMYGATDDTRMRIILDRTRADNLETSCSQLIKMAKGDGSRDNITVLLIHCPA